MKAAIGLALASFVLATPAWADKFFAVTPSGAAEMVFASAQQPTVSALSSKCIDARWTVITSTPAELVCEAPMSMGQSVLGQVLMGNSYSTPPRRFFRFNVAEVNGVSRVQASGWMELQMAFGQTRRTDFSGPEFQNSIFTFMSAAGGKFPVGTTFPNHVVLGFTAGDVAMGAYHGMRIDDLVAGSPAARAGLHQGDVITSVVGKRFKKGDDYLDATAQAAMKPTYVVEYLRDGKKSVATLEREFRPAISEMVAAPAPAVAVVEAAPHASVADELTKLFKLKEAGILTDAEFDSQKQKLLSQ